MDQQQPDPGPSGNVSELPAYVRSLVARYQAAGGSEGLVLAPPEAVDALIASLGLTVQQERLLRTALRRLASG